MGLVALTFGPWAQPPSDITKTILWVGFLAFSMLGTIASNAATALESQADEIAELRRRLGQQGSTT
jgi:hypothetical protein